MPTLMTDLEYQQLSDLVKKINDEQREVDRSLRLLSLCLRKFGVSIDGLGGRIETLGSYMAEANGRMVRLLERD